MATRHQRSTSIGEYLPYHINAATTTAAVANPAVAATGYAGAPLSPPAAPGLAHAAAATTILAGTYQVEVTYVTGGGETLASTASSVTVLAGDNITITSPSAATGAVGWFAYVTQAGGSTFTRQQAAATAIGTNLVLTAPPTSTGVNPPAANTSGPAAAGALPTGSYTVGYTWVRPAADLNNNTQNTTDGVPASYATTTAGTSASAAIAVVGPAGAIAVNANAALPAGASVQWWIITAPAGVLVGPVGAPQTSQWFTIAAGANYTAAMPTFNSTSLVRLPITPTAAYAILDRGKGVFLGTVCVNDFGTAATWVLNIYNGLGGAQGGGANICAIKPNTNVTLDMNNALDYGLFYTVTAGTGTVSFTLNVLPVA